MRYIFAPKNFIFFYSTNVLQVVYMARGKYKAVNIPYEIFLEIQPLMEKYGYRSFAEFVKEALRLRLEDIQATEQVETIKKESGRIIE